MTFFSPSQESIYESSWGFIVRRLEQILDLSPLEPSKEAFFFVLRVMQQHDTEAVQNVINIFYAEHQLINAFLRDLNGWLKVENNNSRFIKALTDSRLRTSEQQSSEYTQSLQKEFAQKVATSLQRWSAENAPTHFYETKYPLLCDKYSSMLKPCAEQSFKSQSPLI